MFSGLLILALIGVIGAASHRRPKLEQKVFKHVPLSDWLTITLFPFMLLVSWAIILKSILNRPNISLLPVDDFDFLMTMVFFVLYAFVGNGLHFMSKIIWRYLDKTNQKKLIYQVNEMFHGKLSHYLIYVCVALFLFLLPLLEINHPLSSPISEVLLYAISAMSIIFGLASAKSVFFTNQWFGGYNRPLSFIVSLLVLVDISFFRYFHLSIQYYPVSIFVIVAFVGFATAFILRQAMIFTRLNQRRKLRYLSRLLSI